MIFAPTLNQRIQDVLEACAREWRQVNSNEDRI